MSINNLLLSFLAIFSMTFLNGCGGGSSVNGTTPSNTQQPLQQPHQLSARDFQSVDILANTVSTGGVKVTTDDKTITISRRGTYRHDESHYQFFINVDNTASTGFNFDNEGWDNAGTDYIVEDGILFRSKSNDSSWSWDVNVAPVTYSEEENLVSVTIDKSALINLGSVIRVGFISRNLDWSVRHFYPGSSEMVEYKIDDVTPPNDTTAPVITLNGAKNIVIQKGHPFSDPGATAKDNVDGDISAIINVDSNVNIDQIGSYHIIYTVEDNAGNKASLKRNVKVVNEINSNGIIIDGNNSDWNDIPLLAETDAGILKAVDTEDTLYLLFVATKPYLINTQFFLDVDNNSATGFQFNGSVWNQGGADYMIENNHLDKNKSNSSAWGWDYTVAPIDFVKHLYTIEVAIPKVALDGLGDSLNIGFIRRDSSWQTEAVLPASGMVNYQLGTTTQARELVLLPGFCGDLWETRGTSETTQISPFSQRNTNNNLILKHNGDWYGTWERTNATTGETEIDIVKYDGVRNRQFLPLNIVREEPLGNDKITDMAFIGDTLFFVFGNELWSTRGSSSTTHMVKKFAGKKIQKLYPSKNFIAVHVTQTGINNDETWIMNASTSTSSERVFKVDVDNAKPIFTHLAENTVYLRGSDGYYKTDYTHFNQKLDFIPLATSDDNLYFYKIEDNNSNKRSLWVTKNNTSASTKLLDFWGNAVNVSSLTHAVYLRLRASEASFNVDIWRLKDGVATRVQENTPRPSPSSSSTKINDFKYIHGNDYYKRKSGSRYAPTYLYQADGSRQGVSVAQLNNSRPPSDPAEDRVFDQPSYTEIDGNLYFTFVKEDESKHIGVIKDNSGEISEIGSCQ
jgi:hypothetical protein